MKVSYQIWGNFIEYVNDKVPQNGVNDFFDWSKEYNIHVNHYKINCLSLEIADEKKYLEFIMRFG